MIQFSFISNDKFRVSLQTDLKELEICLENKCWKSVVVLVGSMVEALLIDHLDYLKPLDKKYKDINTEKMDLDGAVRTSKSIGLLTDVEENLSTVIRKYRNLIHPERAIRLNETVDDRKAKIAFELLQIIVDRLRENKEKKYGYTAEQIMSKVENDQSALSILDHLIKETKEIEKQKLLINLIPKKMEFYLQNIVDAGDEETKWSEKKIEIFSRSYQMIFNAASLEVKKVIMSNFSRVLKEDSEFIVDLHETYLFRARHLKFCESSDVTLIKQHFLNKIDNVLSVDLIEAAEGMSQYISAKKEMVSLMDPIIRTVYHKDEKLKSKGLEFLESEFWMKINLDAEKKGWFISRLNDWVVHLEKKSQTFSAAQTIKALKMEFEAEDIPF